MQKLIQGIHQFHQENFRPLQGLFEQLSKGQKPETLFVTCSDSRIDPNLLTRSKPGDLFILRNAGNIVPPHSAGSGGEAATIEFAVAAPELREGDARDADFRVDLAEPLKAGLDVLDAGRLAPMLLRREIQDPPVRTPIEP